MEERIDDADVEVEGPDELFPSVGRDLTPTMADLEAGKHGNGAWELADPEHVKVAYQEVHAQKQKDRDERRHFFNEEAKDALLDSILLHHRIVKRGLEVMDKLENEPAEVTAKDMQVLTMSQKSAKEVADRGMGRAKASQEETSTVGLLALLTRKQT